MDLDSDSQSKQNDVDDLYRLAYRIGVEEMDKDYDTLYKELLDRAIEKCFDRLSSEISGFDKLDVKDRSGLHGYCCGSYLKRFIEKLLKI